MIQFPVPAEALSPRLHTALEMISHQVDQRRMKIPEKLETPATLHPGRSCGVWIDGVIDDVRD
jgi:hypothetical protein